MSDRPVVRPSREDDIPALTAIYAHHVLHGLASFEEVPPDAAEMAARRRALVERGFPHLVAEVAGRVAGYAYAGPYRQRAAYRFTVEDSVYVAHDMARRGLGRLLLGAVIEAATAAGHRQMIAVVGDSAHAASIGLHESLGFERAALLRSVGFKFGRWVDSVMLQRPLGAGDATLPVKLPAVR